MTYATLDGFDVQSGTVYIPAGGVWWADLELIEECQVSGSATLTLGNTTLVGTIDPTHVGDFGLRCRLRLVGGAGGWSSSLPAKGYHNDAGVTASEIVQDLARETGETLGTFEPSATSVGVDFVRPSGQAIKSLEEAIGSAFWWVELDGTTTVGERTETAAEDGVYLVSDVKADDSLVFLSLNEDELSAVLPGTILSEGLDTPQTIRETRFELTPDSVRVVAWAPPETSQRGRLAKAFTALVAQATDRKIFGKIRYRVAAMSGDRIELQPQSTDAGFPNIGPVIQRPGAAGSHATMVDGSLVLVEFIEGNPRLPVVTGFAEKDGAGHAPDTQTFSVVTTLKLGSSTAAEGLTLGTSHKTWADGHTHVAGTLTAPGGGGAVTGVTGAPVTTAPAVSTKVFAE